MWKLTLGYMVITYQAIIDFWKTCKEPICTLLEKYIDNHEDP